MKRASLAIIATLAATFSASAQVTSLTGRIVIYPAFSYVKTSGAAVVTASFPEKLLEWSVTTGTNANQMNALYVEGPTTLTNGQAKTISLISTTNVFGDALAFDRVNWMAVKAGTNNVDAIHIGGADPDGWAPFAGATNEVVKVLPGGLAMFQSPSAAGYPVATNAHNLRILNGGTNAATYELYIGGAQ
jgi:hypothetical protein